MSTTLDFKINPKVLKKISKYGRTIVLQTLPSQTVDPVAGKVVDGAPANHNVKGFGPLAYEQEFINEDTIKTGDTYFIIAPSDVAGVDLGSIIKEGLLILIDGQRWNTVRFTPYKPGDDVAAYSLQARR